MYTVTISSAGSPDVVSLTDGSTFATLAVSAGRGPKGDGWTGVTYDTETGRFTFTSNDGLGYVSDDITVDLDAAVQAAESAQQAAEAAEQNTINIFDQFGDQYLGPKASDPTVDNDGDPLTEGDIYFNTTDDVLKFYSGTAWVAPEVIATTAAFEAETSANNAATSEQNASDSADAAANSASAALTSENNAATSEQNALTSEQNALTSEQNAATSEQNASSSASAALTSENNAATSEQNASDSESAASTSEQNALASEQNASTSEQNAATSEQNAAGSATDAQNAQNAAEAAFDSFDDRYLGSKASAPTTDNDGDTLTEGVLYWNSTSDQLFIWDGSAWSTASISDTDPTFNSITVSTTVDGRDVSADGSKLDGIEANATADQTAGEIKTAYESNADTNAFTDAEQSKLSGIEANATADQTAAEIKTAYESNADTNAFTDAEQSKLSGIEAGADVTDTANVTAAGALMDSEVTNLADVKAFDPADYVTETSATGSAILPSGTDAQRDGTPSAGYIRFNTTNVSFEGYDGTAWNEIGGAGDNPDNRIINGAFDFWQRGMSGTANGYVAADRWINGRNGGTVTQSRQPHTLGDKFGSNTPEFYLRQTVSGQSGTGAYALTQQNIESVRSYAGETITVLGWARRSSGAGNMVVEGAQLFGTGGSPSVNVFSISPTTITLTSDWEPFAAVITVPSIAGKTIGTDDNDHLAIHFWASAGSDFNTRTNSLGIQTIGVDLWGIHIKRGTHTADATEAYRAPELGPELARCQRYYQYANQGVMGGAVNDIVAVLNYQPPVEFRTLPTVSLTAPAKIDWVNNANYTQSSASISLTFSNKKGGFNIKLPNFSGLTTHSAVTLRSDGGQIQFDAEL